MSAPLALVPKPTATVEQHEEIATILKDMQALNEKGQLASIIIIVGNVDGNWNDRSSSAVRLSEMIGRLDIIRHEWIKRYLAQES